jgi:iron complex outermembrane receptor protein
MFWVAVAMAGYATAGAAQTPASGQGAATSLPPVRVDAPKRRAPSRSPALRTSRAPGTDRSKIASGGAAESAPHVEPATSRGRFRHGSGLYLWATKLRKVPTPSRAKSAQPLIVGAERS